MKKSLPGRFALFAALGVLYVGYIAAHAHAGTPPLNTQSFYTILGVPIDATDLVIKKAFRALAVVYHPDKNPGDTEAEERFKKVNEAYEVLSNSNSRARYDRGKFSQAGSTTSSFESDVEWWIRPDFFQIPVIDVLRQDTAQYRALTSYLDQFSGFFLSLELQSSYRNRHWNHILLTYRDLERALTYQLLSAAWLAGPLYAGDSIGGSILFGAGALWGFGVPAAHTFIATRNDQAALRESREKFDAFVTENGQTPEQLLSFKILRYDILYRHMAQIVPGGPERDINLHLWMDRISKNDSDLRFGWLLRSLQRCGGTFHRNWLLSFGSRTKAWKQTINEIDQALLGSPEFKSSLARENPNFEEDLNRSRAYAEKTGFLDSTLVTALKIAKGRCNWFLSAYPKARAPF